MQRPNVDRISDLCTFRSVGRFPLSISVWQSCAFSMYVRRSIWSVMTLQAHCVTGLGSWPNIVSWLVKVPLILRTGSWKNGTTIIREQAKSQTEYSTSLLLDRPCADPEGGTGGQEHPPPPSGKSQNIGFLSNTDPDHLKIAKLSSQHSMLGYHRHASETPFKWRFAGRPMIAR